MMTLLIVEGVCQCVMQGATATAALLGSHRVHSTGNVFGPTPKHMFFGWHLSKCIHNFCWRSTHWLRRQQKSKRCQEKISHACGNCCVDGSHQTKQTTQNH